MRREREEAPTFGELRRYYSFGNTPHFFFLHENSTQTNGRYQVNANGDIHRFSRNSLGHIIAHGLPDPNCSSRLIVVEGTNALSQVGRVLTDHHLTPILLEPLK